MKLKIALLTFISLPLTASEPTTSPHLATGGKIKMPNACLIQEALNLYNSPGDCFNNVQRNEAIAHGLAGQLLDRQEISMFLHIMTQGGRIRRVDPNCSAKANVLMVVAQRVIDHPEIAQPQ